MQSVTRNSHRDVISVVKQEREFSDKVGFVFDRLVSLLEDKYGGTQIAIHAVNENDWVPTLPDQPKKELSLYNANTDEGHPKVGEETVDETSFVVVYFKGMFQACVDKIQNIWRSVFIRSSELKDELTKEVKDLTLFGLIQSAVGEVWSYIAWFFNEIRDGAEDVVGSKVERPITDTEVNLFKDGESTTLPNEYINQVIGLDKEANGNETTLRQECARKFTYQTKAIVDESIGALFQSAMLFIFPVFGLLQSEEDKQKNVETYYALETLFGGAAAFSAVCEKAGINNEFKEFYYLPWTRDEIELLVRSLATSNEDDLQKRFDLIQRRQKSDDVLGTVQKKAPELLKSHPGLFYDIAKICRYSLSANTHFMNHPPEVTKRQKGVDEAALQHMNNMQDYEDELKKKGTKVTIEKQLNDYLVSHIQDGQSPTKGMVLFTPGGMLKCHKSLHKAGATVHWYQPLTNGMNHLFAFPGMKISDSTSAEDWFSRLNVFNEKMGDNSYQVIKSVLSQWLIEINSKYGLKKVHHYQPNSGVTLIGKSLGTTYAQRLLVDFLDKAPISKTILVAGTGIEDEAHEKFKQGLDARPQKYGTLSLVEYRDMEDPVPTVGGHHLTYHMNDPHEKLNYELNLFSRKEAITVDSILKCNLKDTDPDAPANQGWFSSITIAFAHLSNIWTVLMEIARFNHLGQFHRYVSYTDKNSVPHSKTFKWSTTSHCDKTELNKYLVSSSGWNQRRLTVKVAPYHSTPSVKKSQVSSTTHSSAKKLELNNLVQ